MSSMHPTNLGYTWVVGRALRQLDPRSSLQFFELSNVGNGILHYGSAIHADRFFKLRLSPQEPSKDRFPPETFLLCC